MAIDTDFERELHRGMQAPPAGSLFETFAHRAMRRVEDVIVARDCKWPPESAHVDLLHLLRNHQGRNRAVPLLALTERLRTSERAVKMTVAELRTHFGVLICSSRGGAESGFAAGYWIAASQQEVYDTLVPYRAQALSELRLIVAMQRDVLSIDQLLTQLRLELQEGEANIARP